MSRHSWIMSAANVCAHRGVPKDEARTLIAQQLTRLPNPAHEIEDAITKAYDEISSSGVSLKSSSGVSLKSPPASEVRMSWPPLAAPSQSKIGAVAESLGIASESAEIAEKCGLLTTLPCGGLVVTDTSRRCALRLGPQLQFLPGSERGWPVGLSDDDCAVALVAGAGGLLGAVHLLACVGLAGVITPAAVLAAASIAQDALGLLAGRRVRLFGEGFANWAVQLLCAGAEVDCYSFAGLLRDDGQPVRTLNDFVRIDPDQWEAERTDIDAAFQF